MNCSVVRLSARTEGTGCFSGENLRCQKWEATRSTGSRRTAIGAKPLSSPKSFMIAEPKCPRTNFFPTSEPRGRRSNSGQVVAASKISRSEEHTSELQSRLHLVCRLLLEQKKS